MRNQTVVRKLTETKGRFFSVTFVKADGTIRHLNGKLAAATPQHVETFKKGRLVVFDAQANGFRTVTLSRLLGATIDGRRNSVG